MKGKKFIRFNLFEWNIKFFQGLSVIMKLLDMSVILVNKYLHFIDADCCRYICF